MYEHFAKFFYHTPSSLCDTEEIWTNPSSPRALFGLHGYFKIIWIYREYLDVLGFQVDIGSDEGRQRVFAAFLSVCRFSLFPSLLPSNSPFLNSLTILLNTLLTH